MGRKGSSGGAARGLKMTKFTKCIYETVRGCFKMRQWEGRMGRSKWKRSRVPFSL